MLLRKVAGLALAAGVLVSVAGCSFNPSPDTLQSYAPSDGVGVDLTFGFHNLESIKVRNFLVVTDGTQSSLFGTIVNSGKKAEVVELQLVSDSTKSEAVTIKAGETYVYDVAHPTTLPLEGKAGQLIQLKVRVANNTDVAFQEISVPILDGTIDYYKNLLTPAPAATN